MVKFFFVNNDYINSVSKIGNCVFYRCLSLTQITVSSSLAFIKIPSSVTFLNNDEEANASANNFLNLYRLMIIFKRTSLN